MISVFSPDHIAISNRCFYRDKPFAAGYSHLVFLFSRFRVNDLPRDKGIHAIRRKNLQSIRSKETVFQPNADHAVFIGRLNHICNIFHRLFKTIGSRRRRGHAVIEARIAHPVADFLQFILKLRHSCQISFFPYLFQ